MTNVDIYFWGKFFNFDSLNFPWDHTNWLKKCGPDRFGSFCSFFFLNWHIFKNNKYAFFSRTNYIVYKLSLKSCELPEKNVNYHW